VINGNFISARASQTPNDVATGELGMDGDYEGDRGDPPNFGVGIKNLISSIFSWSKDDF
jgi:hypothetical protein